MRRSRCGTGMGAFHVDLPTDVRRRGACSDGRPQNPVLFTARLRGARSPFHPTLDTMEQIENIISHGTYVDSVFSTRCPQPLDRFGHRGLRDAATSDYFVVRFCRPRLVRSDCPDPAARMESGWGTSRSHRPVRRYPGGNAADVFARATPGSAGYSGSEGLSTGAGALRASRCRLIREYRTYPSGIRSR